MRPYVLRFPSLLALIALLTLTREATGQTPTVEMAPCEVPGVSRMARCGRIDVPENYDQPKGRQITLSLVVIPAAEGSASADPIVPLMGGPGEDAISAAELFARQFESLLRERDLVLVDQRGTGKSAGLQCDLYSPEEPEASLRDLYPVAAVRRCQKQLSKRADLTQYGFIQAARDLENVRRALKYNRLHIYSGSYGTRAAQVYMRAYPASVATAYLGSALPLDVSTPLTMAKTAQATLEGVLNACAAEPVCRAAFPNLREELKEIAARLDSGTVRVPIPGTNRSAQLNRGRVAEWMRSMAYRPSSAVILPWAIHHAHQGNWNPIVDGILAYARGFHSAASVGVFFSITCNDDVAFIREEDIARETQNTLLGDYRVRQQQAACKDWPKTSHPSGYRTPVRSTIPTLFVSGDSDGASPLWFVERVIQGFPEGVHVVVGGQGHTEWSDCAARLYEQLVRDGSVKRLRGASCKPVPRPPFRTR